VHVPEGATCARFTFRTGELAGPHMLVLHALQLLPEVAATGRNPHELDRYIRLKPHHEVVEHLAVRGGVTLEVCLCKFWSSVGSCAADVEVEFHGVALGARTLTVTPAGPEPLEIATPLRAETLAVTARATRVRRLLAPTKAAIRALDPARHLLPRGRQVYELELHYAFEQGEKEAVKCQPGVPGLSELLYDSPLEAQMWMVFDANKQLMGAGDALHDYPVTLPKGKYTARLSLRHDQRDALDKLKGTLMAVDFALAKEVSLGVYASLHAAVSGGAKYSGGAAAAGGRVVVYVAPPTDKAAGAKPGDLLLGAVTAATLGEYRAECALRCVVGKEEEAEDDKDEPTRTDDELLADALRDARLGRLKKLREEKKWEAFDKLAAAAAAEHPAHLPLLREVLAREGADGGDAQDPPRRRARCAAAVRAARAVVAACDPAGLAAHYGLRHDGDDAAQKAARKDADARKEALVEAALARAERLAELLEPAPGRAAADGGGGLEAGGPGVMEELGEAWGLVRQWVVPKEAKPDVQARYAHAASFSAIQA
jgi:tripeptidyl-peptidase II